MKVECSQEINKSLVEVFAFVTCYHNDPRWSGFVVHSEQITTGPTRVGTTLKRVERLVGKEFTLTAEIIEYIPNARSSLKSVSSPLPQIETRHFEATATGTRFSLVVECKLVGYFRLNEGLVSRFIRRQIETDLNNLKDLLEYGVDELYSSTK